MFRSAVGHANPDEDVVHVRLGILDLHVEVAVLIEDACVDQLELGIEAIAFCIFLAERRVRKCRLRVLVQAFHVTVRGGVVEIVVVLLHVLAVIPLDVVQAEEPFLQDRIASIPQRHGKADGLMAIAETGEAVFVPAVDARSCVIVRKVCPGVAVGAVILADGAPRALGEVRAPALPVLGAKARLLETTPLGGRARIERAIVVRHVAILASTRGFDYSSRPGERNSTVVVDPSPARMRRARSAPPSVCSIAMFTGSATSCVR